jgi:hypothetical protein
MVVLHPGRRRAELLAGIGSPPALAAGRMTPVKRQNKSGASAKRKKGSSPRPLTTKDSFAKTVELLPDGSRKVSLSPDAMELLEHQREMFREKFGREPGPHDPIFFDENADEPREMPPLDPMVLESVAVEAGIRPEIAFAMAKTGVFLVKDNEHLYSDEDKEDFWAAVEEYRERAKRQDA